MKTRGIFYLLIAAGLLMTYACSSPQKLVEEGRYETAIAKARKKLVGKEHKSPKHVKALEAAFRKANERDLARVHALENSAQPKDWDEIFAIGRRIENRQAMVRPLLPLVDKKGYEATFRMVKTEEILYKAKDNAVMAWYDLAREYLNQAEKGDYQAARQALEALERIQRYHANYRDVSQLVRHARDLGTVRVLVRLENEESYFISPALEREILDLNLSHLRSEWVEFVDDPTLGHVQFEVILRVHTLRVSPESIEEREFHRSKEIEDGFQYVLDANGNVMKDSLGNDIKVPKIVEVQATILETFQEKMSYIEGEIEFRDLQDDRVLHREPVAVEAAFRHKAQRFFGDKRALSNHERKIIPPASFPSDEEMILMAIDELKGRFINRIEHSDLL